MSDSENESDDDHKQKHSVYRIRDLLKLAARNLKPNEFLFSSAGGDEWPGGVNVVTVSSFAKVKQQFQNQKNKFTYDAEHFQDTVYATVQESDHNRDVYLTWHPITEAQFTEMNSDGDDDAS